jgi:poly-gamma-glutamate capsule biosynthesis protein CapA/YwtB (metallophosphatase superfamily)
MRRSKVSSYFAVVVIAAGVLVYALLRTDSPRPAVDSSPDSTSATIASAGDILLGDAASPALERNGYSYPFQHLQRLLSASDLLVGNLEGPITDVEQPFLADKAYVYKQAPQVAAALRKAGFDMLALGNNHAMDHGPQGLQDTREYLRAAGISSFGAGANAHEARRGLVIDVNGTRVGLLSYLEPYDSLEQGGWYAEADRPGVARLTIESVREDIGRIRRSADVVIVHAHFGRNYQPVTDYQRTISRQMIDAGADAVNGHHSHTAQGVDIYKGKPILYGLGNFTFGTPGRFKDMPGYGWIARYNLSARRIVSFDLDLIATDNRRVKFQPELVGTKEAKRAWAELSIGFTAEPTWHGSTARIALPAPR